MPFRPSCLVKRVPLDGEGLQPRFGGLWIDVAETIAKRGSTPFYFSKDAFDGIPISVTNGLKSEAGSLESGR
ncbi:hypothetical protein GCM10009066_21660 [Halarchaeum salinum]|uniref:Uncharacterized protein n=1 Tax=Halarchaeum salinum TaxID=489912 RepID=A0AAV3SAE1_9EURY